MTSTLLEVLVSETIMRGSDNSVIPTRFHGGGHSSLSFAVYTRTFLLVTSPMSFRLLFSNRYYFNYGLGFHFSLVGIFDTESGGDHRIRNGKLIIALAKHEINCLELPLIEQARAYYFVCCKE